MSKITKYATIFLEFSTKETLVKSELTDEEIRKTLLGERDYELLHHQAIVAFGDENRAQEFVASLKKEENNLDAKLKHPEMRAMCQRVALGIRA